MEWLTWIQQRLADSPTLAFFVVLGLGYLIGKVGFRGLTLGPVAGVLFAGLLFGHYGFRASAAAQEFGFALFIFSVGYQAGPRFFSVLMTDGLRYFALALVIAVAGFVPSVWLSRVLGLDFGAAAGLLGGAMTTTPTLAAAEEAVRKGVIELPPGMTIDQVTADITTTYAITYLFGLLGLLMMIRLLPPLLRIDLVAEARKLDLGTDVGSRQRSLAQLSLRAYRISSSEFQGQPLVELENQTLGRAVVMRIRRQGEMIQLDASTVMEPGDEVVIMADSAFFVEQRSRLGEEVFDPELLELKTAAVEVVVTHPACVGKPLRELRRSQPSGFGTMILGVRRTGVELPLNEKLVMQKGDVVSIVAPDAQLDRLTELVGPAERNVDETDLLTFATGVSGGILLGTLTVQVGGLSLGLGAAGGLLVAGLVIGYLRSIKPIFGRVPSAARWLLMELGLLMFMASVGLNAGAEIVDTLITAGPKIVLAGVVVTTIPVAVGWLVGRKVLRLNPALLLGGIAGAMTSGACLKVVTEAAKSPAPALGYTGAYAFANVLLTIAGSTILYFQ
jgi:putative transport protein